jgi:hypothetical protein
MGTYPAAAARVSYWAGMSTPLGVWVLVNAKALIVDIHISTTGHTRATYNWQGKVLLGVRAREARRRRRRRRARRGGGRRGGVVARKSGVACCAKSPGIVVMVLAVAFSPSERVRPAARSPPSPSAPSPAALSGPALPPPPALPGALRGGVSSSNVPLHPLFPFFSFLLVRCSLLLLLRRRRRHLPQEEAPVAAAARTMRAARARARMHPSRTAPAARTIIYQPRY